MFSSHFIYTRVAESTFCCQNLGCGVLMIEAGVDSEQHDSPFAFEQHPAAGHLKFIHGIYCSFNLCHQQNPLYEAHDAFCLSFSLAHPESPTPALTYGKSQSGAQSRSIEAARSYLALGILVWTPQRISFLSSGAHHLQSLLLCLSPANRTAHLSTSPTIRLHHGFRRRAQGSGQQGHRRQEL